MTKSLSDFSGNVKSFPAWTHEVCFGWLNNWHKSKQERPRLTEVRPAADFIQGLATDTPAKMDCRRAAENGDAKAKDDAKGKIDYWAIAGAYVGENAPQNTFAQLDFDRFETRDAAEAAKAIIAELGCALIVSYSASGRGVFAVVDTGGRFDRDTLRERYLMPLSRILTARGIAHNADDKPLGVGHGRVEGFDPDPYVAPRRVVFDVERVARTARRETRDAELRQERETRRGFYAHPISKIARAFRATDAVGGLSTAAALALVGSICDVRSKVDNRPDHAARAFCYVIQQMGIGKTDMINALETARRTAGDGYAIAKPKSDAALAEILRTCGSMPVQCMDATGRTKTRLEPIPESDAPKHAIFMFDEGGAFLKSVAKNEKCGDMDSALCGAFGARFTPPMTKSDLESGIAPVTVQANATVLLCATPAQWIDYAATEDESNGMLRRRLVFMPDEMGEIERADGRAPTLADLDEETPDTGIDEPLLWRYAGDLVRIPRKAVFRVTREARESSGRVTQALSDAGIPQSAWETLATNYATLCAAARCAIEDCTDYEVTPRDYDAVADIIAESVCKARAKIADRVELRGTRKFKSGAEVWGEIHDYIEKATPRTDAMARWLRNRPPIYRDTYNDMLSRGDVVIEATGRDRRRAVRLATEAEAEAAEAKRAEQRQSVFDGNVRKATGKAKEYAECNDAEKESRVLAYVEKWRADNPTCEGNRNNAINKLVHGLQKAGMWDSVAQGMAQQIAEGCGLRWREIKTLLRDRKIAG